MLGLLIFGATIIAVVVKLLTNSEAPLSSIGTLQRAGYAGMLLVIGCAATSCALVMRDSACGLINRGKALFLISGVLMLAGTATAATAVVGAGQSLRVVGQSTSVPKLEVLNAAMSPLVSRVNVALGIMATASVLALVGGLSGVGSHAMGTPSRSSVLEKLVWICTVLLLLLAGYGLLVRGGDLARLINGDEIQPAEIAATLIFSLSTWVAVFVGVGVLGVLQSVAAGCAVTATQSNDAVHA
jgi:hypothetical protein